jgi:hypothetical protein
VDELPHDQEQARARSRRRRWPAHGAAIDAEDTEDGDKKATHQPYSFQQRRNKKI